MDAFSKPTSDGLRHNRSIVPRKASEWGWCGFEQLFRFVQNWPTNRDLTWNATVFTDYSCLAFYSYHDLYSTWFLPLHECITSHTSLLSSTIIALIALASSIASNPSPNRPSLTRSIVLPSSHVSKYQLAGQDLSKGIALFNWPWWRESCRRFFTYCHAT